MIHDQTTKDEMEPQINTDEHRFWDVMEGGFIRMRKSGGGVGEGRGGAGAPCGGQSLSARGDVIAGRGRAVSLSL